MLEQMNLEIKKMRKPKEIFDIDKIWENVCEITSNSKYILASITLFDFPNSSKLKKSLGQKRSLRIILFHNQVCRYFIHEFNGYVVKELGDGLLAVFDDPVKACMCSVEVRKRLNVQKLATKIAITSGHVQKIRINGNVDFLGPAVDKCARIEQHLEPNQILIDDNSYNRNKIFLGNTSGIKISLHSTLDLKDFGPTRVFLIH